METWPPHHTHSPQTRTATGFLTPKSPFSPESKSWPPLKNNTEKPRNNADDRRIRAIGFSVVYFCAIQNSALWIFHGRIFRCTDFATAAGVALVQGRRMRRADTCGDRGATRRVAAVPWAGGGGPAPWWTPVPHRRRSELLGGGGWRRRVLRGFSVVWLSAWRSAGRGFSGSWIFCASVVGAENRVAWRATPIFGAAQADFRGRVGAEGRRWVTLRTWNWVTRRSGEAVRATAGGFARFRYGGA